MNGWNGSRLFGDSMKSSSRRTFFLSSAFAAAPAAAAAAAAADGLLADDLGELGDLVVRAHDLHVDGDADVNVLRLLGARRERTDLEPGEPGLRVDAVEERWDLARLRQHLEQLLLLLAQALDLLAE